MMGTLVCGYRKSLTLGARCQGMLPARLTAVSETSLGRADWWGPSIRSLPGISALVIGTAADSAA